MTIEILFVLILWLSIYLIGTIAKPAVPTHYQEAFDAVYGKNVSSPSLKCAAFYSYPSFTVTFRNRAERDLAQENGLNEAFKRAIAELCIDHHKGKNKPPFDVDLAIAFIYEGYLDDMRSLRGGKPSNPQKQ